MMTLDPWYLENLRCPVSGSMLRFDADSSALVTEQGRVYPVVEGVPVMLPREVVPTLSPIEASLEADPADAPWYLNSVLLSDAEKAGIRELIHAGKTAVDPVAAYLVAATNGVGYAHLVGRLKEYPIPEMRLPFGDGRLLLDVGCSWGRWCVASAQKGYSPIGMDPSLGAVMAARRITLAMGLKLRFVVGDARHLPFRPCLFDDVFSYSVIQHFSVADATRAFGEMGRVLKGGGLATIQMPTRYGLRCWYNQARRAFRGTHGFEVRYWRMADLRSVFEQCIGTTRFTIDCFFGIGWQPSDARLMPPLYRMIIHASEALRILGRWFPGLQRVADSVYVHSLKKSTSTS